MKEELKQIKEDAFNELKNKKLDIEDIRIKYLGKKGELTKILRGMKELPKEERPVIGKLANEVRSALENAIEEASKKIKSNDILNIAKKEFAYKKLLLTISGQEYEVLIQEKLNDTSITNLVTDLIERYEYCKTNNIEFNTIQHIYFLLVKYFTDIKFNTYKELEKSYKHELDTISALIDLEVFDQILNQFDKDTLVRIQNMFDKYSNQLKSVVNDEVKKAIIEGE